MRRAPLAALVLAGLTLGCNSLGEYIGKELATVFKSSDGSADEPRAVVVDEEGGGDEGGTRDWDAVVNAYRSATGQDDDEEEAAAAPTPAPHSPSTRAAPAKGRPVAFYVDGTGNVVQVTSVDDVPPRHRGSMVVLGGQLPGGAGGVSVVNDRAGRDELDRATASWKRRTAVEERNASRRRGRSRGRVILFQTSWCPACTAAREYLDREGIGYEARNVERDAGARKEFRRYGGNSVPLLLVNGTPIRGFDPKAIQRALR